MLYEKAIDQVCVDLFDPQGHPGYEAALKEMKSSRGRELRDLLPKGMGIHHAGMARSDRNLMEKLFGSGVLKVLCCTATLAWGVNLPAAAVSSSHYQTDINLINDIQECLFQHHIMKWRQLHIQPWDIKR